jgi:hypothetical protein
VVTFPFSTPSGPLLEIPKDQYRLAVDVAERLYDGGSDKVLQQQRNLEAELVSVQTDIDAYQIRGDGNRPVLPRPVHPGKRCGAQVFPSRIWTAA